MVVLTVTACLAFVMMLAEADTVLGQFCCTAGSLGVLALSAKGLDKLGAFDNMGEDMR